MWLRQSTASQEILLGRFVDSTDGNTEETGLTIANTDIKIWKEGATTLASKNSGGATHIANGNYYAVLDATDTDTLGKLEVHVHVSGALSVLRTFMVVPAMIYDSLVLGTDDLDTNVTKMNNVSASAITTIKAVQGLATDGVVPTVTNLTNLPAGRVIPAGDIGDFPEDHASVVLRFNTVGITMAPITLAGTPALSVYKDSTTESTAGVTLTVDYDSRTGTHHVLIDTSADAFYEVGKSYTVVITTGTVSGVSVVGSVVGSFSIENRFQEVDLVKIGASAQSATDLKDFADDGYDPSTNKVQGVVLTDTTTTVTNQVTANTTAISGDSAAADNLEAALDGTGGVTISAALTGNITGNLSGSVGSVTGAVGSVTGAVGSVTGAVGSVTGAVGSVTGNVGGNVTGSVGSLAAQAKSDVNAEVVDALATDTYAEPGQGAPAATTTLAAKINYLYKAWRNKKTQTATTFSLYNDAESVVDQKATHSDDATTYTSGEIGTGP